MPRQDAGGALGIILEESQEIYIRYCDHMYVNPNILSYLLNLVNSYKLVNH